MGDNEAAGLLMLLSNPQGSPQPQPSTPQNSALQGPSIPTVSSVPPRVPGVSIPGMAQGSRQLSSSLPVEQPRIVSGYPLQTTAMPRPPALGQPINLPRQGTFTGMPPMSASSVVNPVQPVTRLPPIRNNSPPLHYESNNQRRQRTPQNRTMGGMKHVTSPGPAAAALAGRTGSNNRAMIAAAALAAAAATPLPLLSKVPTLKPEIPQGDGVGTDKSATQKQAPRRKRTHSQSEAMETAAKIAGQLARLEKKKTETGMKREKAVESKHNSKPDYAVSPDSGIISCVCGYSHDDGFTIQCDRCFRWQHAVCMGIQKVEDAPERYLCYRCDPTKHVSAEKARQIQQLKLQTIEATEKEAKRKAEAEKKEQEARAKRRRIEREEERFALKRCETFYLSISHYEYSSSTVMSLMKRLPRLMERRSGALEFRNTADFSRRLARPSTVLVESEKDENHKKEEDHEEIPSPVASKSGSPGSKHSRNSSPVPFDDSANFTGLSRVCLVTREGLSRGQPIYPMYGGLQLKQDYLEERTNKYWLLGCCKPSAFFHPTLPIVIDERAVGNLTRFTRKSCHANCEIRSAIIGGRRCVFVLVAKRDIAAGEELTLPWEWDSNHPVHKLDALEQLARSDKVSGPDFTRLFNSIHSICSVAQCACVDKSQCLIARVKNMAENQYTRHPGIQLISPAPNQSYEPIEQRMVNREARIQRRLAAKRSGNSGHGISNKELGVVKESTGNEIEESESIQFQKPIDHSVLNAKVVPTKFKIVKQYLEKEKEQMVKLKKAGANTKKISVETLYTPFKVNPDELERINTYSTPDSATKKSIRQPVQTNMVKKLVKPRVVRKFSLADYKRKTKAVGK